MVVIAATRVWVLELVNSCQEVLLRPLLIAIVLIGGVEIVAGEVTEERVEKIRKTI